MAVAAGCRLPFLDQQAVALVLPEAVDHDALERAEWHLPRIQVSSFQP